jgi:hypothetical protein
MIFRRLDENDDWTFGKGKNNFLKDLNAVKLDIKTRLSFWVGDCFFSSTEGVDYNNYLDVGTKDFLDLDIKKNILKTENVQRITGFESSIDADRNYSAKAKIMTIYGETEIIL